MFYTLFAIVYGKLFELKVPTRLADRAVLKLEKAKAIEAGLADQLKRAAASIKDESAPQEVLKVARGAVTRCRLAAYDDLYLAGNGNNPCPPLP